MEWFVFIEMIFKFLDACMKRDGREVVAARIQRGGIFVRGTLRFLAGQAGFRGDDRRAAVNEVLDHLREGGRDGIERLLEEVAEANAA